MYTIWSKSKSWIWSVWWRYDVRVRVRVRIRVRVRVRAEYNSAVGTHTTLNAIYIIMQIEPYLTTYSNSKIMLLQLLWYITDGHLGFGDAIKHSPLLERRTTYTTRRTMDYGRWTMDDDKWRQIYVVYVVPNRQCLQFLAYLTRSYDRAKSM